MNYQEMSDEQINHSVAIARGTKIKECNGLALHQVSGDDLCADFCNSWADAGPIVSENNISLYPTEIAWIAGSTTFHVSATHENPLRAAMIVFLMMRLTMDESRRQFEQWIKAERPKLFLDLLETYPTRYFDPATERLWQSWQASRQAIEIETPPRINGIHLRQPKEVEDMWLHRLKFAVESAGLKIKGVP